MIVYFPKIVKFIGLGKYVKKHAHFRKTNFESNQQTKVKINPADCNMFGQKYL